MILSLFMLSMPGLIHAQGPQSEIEVLKTKVDELSQMVDRLKAEQSHSADLDQELQSWDQDFTRRDSLRLIALRRKQSESRARIDALTVEIIRLSKQLEDPRKRFALAKKLKQSKYKGSQAKPEQQKSVAAVDSISARSIDLLAIKLVRQGKSLDQARLLTIEKLDNEQVLSFYRGLSKTERYKLYDIADGIVASEQADLMDARRSAIYFYLFAEK